MVKFRLDDNKTDENFKALEELRSTGMFTEEELQELTENFIQNAIHLDAGAEVMYGSNQTYDTYPCRFPTVEFQLMATDALVEVADRIRMEKGYLPMHPRDGRTDDVDCDGWYNFYVGVSKLPGDHQECQLDSSISFVVVNSDSDDNEDMYNIDLTETEREYVYEILNRQCRRYHGKDCVVLLAESEKELMIQHENYQAKRC